MTISGVQKSADAFRTISEVAETLKLPQHVLRFWETRFTQIKPMKRAGGRRFYRPEDVELLGAIRRLLYGEGYTIKGVQRILKEQGPRAVALLARQHGEPAPFEPVAEDLPEDLAEPPSATGAPPASNGHGEAVRAAGAEAAHPAPFSIDGLVADAAAEAAVDPIERLRHVLVEIEACREMLIAARG